MARERGFGVHATPTTIEPADVAWLHLGVWFAGGVWEMIVYQRIKDTLTQLHIYCHNEQWQILSNAASYEIPFRWH